MNTAKSIEDWVDALENRPEVFPHNLDLVSGRLLLVELSADQISSASFLDQRVLTPTTSWAWVPWPLVSDIFKNLPVAKPASFIFHVGHCGSTLLSRLLAFAQDTQCLREPLPLRTLAQDFANDGDGRSFLTQPIRQEYLMILSKMWCRGSVDTVIKATSICTDLLADINTSAPGSKSIFIYNRPETHIATLLAGQNALTDLKGFAQLRLQRLQQKTGLDIQLNQLTAGQLAALSWLSETSSATRSLEACPQQIKLLEFDSMLDDPNETLTGVLHHLGITATVETIDKAVQSPVLQTYSKAPEHRYNAQTRAAILADSRVKFREDINDALGWLDNLAGRSELVSTTLKKFS